MKSYYNEYDPKAAAWLRELIRCGHVADGTVDTRSIADVRPEDLAGYTRCHFFAGIGGWDYALRLAGWPDDRPVWTGSCPCQPFSSAGKQLGNADARHLWPVFGRLIAQCRPPVVFGEQVASKLGREWLSGVRADLEGMGYAVGGADLCAAGVGSPHIRQRLYWVADAERIAIRTEHIECKPTRIACWESIGDASPWSNYEFIPCTDGKQRRTQSGLFPLAHGIPGRVGLLRGYGNAIVAPLAAEFIKASVEAAFIQAVIA